MLIAIGSFGFWLFLAAFTILFWICIETESPRWATTSMIGAFVALAYLGDFNLITFAKMHPLGFLGMVAAYLFGGVVYSIIKWWRYCKLAARKYRELETNWAEAGHLNLPLTSVQKKSFFEYSWEAKELSSRPKARKNKSRILTWMIYWPFSATWTLINDPIVRFFKEAFARLSNVFDKISARAYKGIEG